MGFYALYFVLYRRYFSVSPAKLLYVFLVVQAYSTAINVVCKFADVRLFPDHFSKVTATSYSLMVIGLLAASVPFMWRFFTRRLRRAFDNLPDSGFWRFAVAPGIFFVVNQIYINLLYGRMFRETGRLEIQTFLIFLLELPARVGVPDSDLAVLFGNLFENAANALARQARGPRLLTARCMIQNGMLVLTLDNSADPPEQREERGVGQSSVAALAEKYGGTARFEREGTLYRASVLLHLPDAPPGGGTVEENGHD